MTMKRSLSIFALFARSSFRQMGLIFIALALVQTVIFYFTLGNLTAIGMPGLEIALDSSPLLISFIVAFTLLAFVLCRIGSETGSRVSYTLRRLALSEKQIFLLQSVYNTLAFLLLWLFEALVIFGLCQLYPHWADQTLVTNQTVMLAAYRSKFFHLLMPLSDYYVAIALGLFWFSTGVSSAMAPFQQRRHGGKPLRYSFVPLMMIYILLQAYNGQSFLILSFIYGFMVVLGIWSTLCIKEEMEE